MSAWMLIFWAIIGSAVTIAVNALVIDRIYGRKERKWDAFCEKAAENADRIKKLELQAAPVKFDKYE